MVAHYFHELIVNSKANKHTTKDRVCKVLSSTNRDQNIFMGNEASIPMLGISTYQIHLCHGHTITS